MASTVRKKRKRLSRQTTSPKNKANSLLLIGVATVVVGLLIFGTASVLGIGRSESTTADLDAPAGGHPLAADPETEFLGPPTDAASLAQAEQGALDTPTLVWFHADW